MKRPQPLEPGVRVGIPPERLLVDEIRLGIVRVRRLMQLEATRLLARQPGLPDILGWQALNYLDQYGPMAQAGLAEGLGQHAPGISRLMDELEREHLVRRSKARNDRRLVVVQISRRGKARLEAGRPAVDAAVEHVLGPLDLDDRRALRNLLWRMIPQK